MSDVDAALAFANVFNALADEDLMMTAPELAKKVARRIWSSTCAFDFTPRQMYCDEALERLGLARRIQYEYNPDETELEYLPR